MEIKIQKNRATSRFLLPVTARSIIKRHFAAVAFLAVVIVSAAGCGRIEKVGYSRYRPVNPRGWTREATCFFNMEESADTISFSEGVYDVVLSVRHTADYPYNEVWLAWELASLDGGIRTDTVGIRLADSNGRWLGKGERNLILRHDTILRNVYLDRSWEFSVGHVSRSDTLKGINDIGVILLKK